jgi:hypothetical protein
MSCQCPACYRRDIAGYHLRAKSQIITETIFLVPQYSGLGQYFSQDFNLLQTTVCPECLFASPDPKDWTRQNQFTKSIIESQLSMSTKLMTEIRNQEFERKTKYPKVKEDLNYFIRPRTVDKARESIELSIMRAMLELKHQIPAANFKLGSYYLKLADIAKKQNKDSNPAFETAGKYFRAAVEKSDCPNDFLEMESIYQVVALNLFFQKKEVAAEFVKIAKNVLLQKENDVKENPKSGDMKLRLTEVDKWERRIGVLWEYRDDPDFWKNT